MNTKFSTAIHSLILISEAQKPLSSEEIAKSVGSNSSYVRKVLGILKKTGIIKSKQGVSGFSLTCPAEDINLYNIYNAVESSPFFDIHQNPNDQCIVGRHIKPVLSGVLSDIEEALQLKLKSIKLSDCIIRMKNELTEEEKQIYDLQDNL